MVNTREQVDHGSWKFRASVKSSESLSRVDEANCEKGEYQIPPPTRSTNTKRSFLSRCQRRMSILLHTHVVLICVCTLAALDAVCVIGQLICDILIMREKLDFAEETDELLTKQIFKYIPHINQTLHERWNLDAIRHVLEGTDVHFDTFGPLPTPPPWMTANLTAMVMNPIPWVAHKSVEMTAPIASTLLSNATDVAVAIGNETMHALHRHKRALAPMFPGHEVDHGVLYTMTHIFHLSSMAILSILLLETIFKTFAMGRKLRHHKLEVRFRDETEIDARIRRDVQRMKGIRIFDACVVVISWCLDVAFYQGIWAHPGTTSATILIYMLPWRVVRIVNSFVLVIQEKDHVTLKIVKQRLRQSIKKSRNQEDKRHVLTHEVKALAGLCRKMGAHENEIQACSPSGSCKRRSSVGAILLLPKQLFQNFGGTSRRRSSVKSVLERSASLAMMSAMSSMGSNPSLFDMGNDSSGDEDEYSHKHKTLSATSSAAPTMNSAFSSTTLDSNSVVLSIDHDHNNDSGINTPHYDTRSTASAVSKDDDKHINNSNDDDKQTVVWTTSNDSLPPNYDNISNHHVAVSKMNSNTRL